LVSEKKEKIRLSWKKMQENTKLGGKSISIGKGVSEKALHAKYGGYGRASVVRTGGARRDLERSLQKTELQMRE